MVDTLTPEAGESGESLSTHERAELLRLTAAALAGLRPLMQRLSPRAQESVSPVLAACAAARTAAEMDIETAHLAVVCFAKMDRRRTPRRAALSLLQRAGSAA